MRTAIYCRVSTDDQRDSGTSLDTQLQKSIEYANEKEWSIVETFSETYSGGYLDRPMLNQVRSLIRARAVDVVLVYAFDRLSRDQVHPFILFGEMRDNHVKLISVMEGAIESAEDIFIKLGLFSYKASGERAAIRERTMRGRRERAERGIPAGGVIPYGYQWRIEPLAGAHDKRNEMSRRCGLDLDPLTAPHVLLMFQLAIDGVSLRGIADELNRRGITTPRHKKQWVHTQVRMMLTNPTYAGRREVYRWIRVPTGRDNNKSTTILSNPTDRIVLPEGVVEPLVDEAIFMAVQRRLQLNSEHSKRNAKYPPEKAMLRGFAVCQYCGAKMTVKRGGPNNAYYQYRCSRNDRLSELCIGTSIPCSKLDGEVWQQFYEILSTPSLIEAALQSVAKDDPTAGDIAAIDSAESSVREELANIAENIGKVHGMLLTLAQEKADALESRLNHLQAERERLSARQEGWRDAQERVRDLSEWCKYAETRLKNADYEMRKNAFIATGLVVRVASPTSVPRWNATLTLGGEWGFADKIPASSVHKTPCVNVYLAENDSPEITLR